MNLFAELPKAGLTPDQNGQFRLGSSEVARLNDYFDRKDRDDEDLYREDDDE